MKAASVYLRVLDIAFRAFIGADMRKTLLFLAFSLLAGAAQAQIKCWNQDGKRVCGDAPPPGAKVTTLNTPSGPAAAPADKAAASKDAKKGPLTPAEQDQEYRKRQAEAQKADAKAAEERRIAEAKRQNCANARSAVAGLASGQRIQATNPTTGERYYLEEAQIASQLTRARAIEKENCD
jgi:hypothetical protein